MSGKGAARVGRDRAGSGVLLPAGSATKVFADGALVARLGTGVTPHGSSPHGSGVTVVQASSKVFAEGVAVARQGDLASCGDAITPGSSKVFIG